MKIKKCVLDNINATAKLALRLMVKYISKDLLYLEIKGRPMNMMDLYALLGFTQSNFDKVMNRLIQANIAAILLGEDLEIIVINPYIFADRKMNKRQSDASRIAFNTKNTDGKHWELPQTKPAPRKAVRYAMDRIRRLTDGK